jgi:hypothetical protein
MMDSTRLSAAVLSGVLLIFAAGCSLEKTRSEDSQVQSAGTKQHHQDQDNAAKPTLAASSTSFVANPFCLACHADFQEEKLALRHERAAIGCERCHGESDRHRSDEANLTPPEIMYPRAKINPTCMMCHPRDQINRVDQHAIILAGAQTVLNEVADASRAENHKKVCTSCHGEHHQMKRRTIRWNKATGELLK